jgi:hypothetical protein
MPRVGSQKGRKVVVVEIGEFFFVTVVSVILSSVILVAFWPWMRNTRRLVGLAIGMILGIVAWNLMLNVTNATAMNVDSVFRVSGQDVGSGIFACAAAALVLGLVADPREAAGRVVGAAGIAGLITILVDLFG